jgi:hypothetical protein
MKISSCLAIGPRRKGCPFWDGHDLLPSLPATHRNTNDKQTHQSVLASCSLTSLDICFSLSSEKKTDLLVIIIVRISAQSWNENRMDRDRRKMHIPPVSFPGFAQTTRRILCTFHNLLHLPPVSHLINILAQFIAKLTDGPNVNTLICVQRF